MGPLSLPSRGRVYLDANAFIYSAERIEPFRTLLEPLWTEAHAGRFSIVSSDLVVLETLVKPLRDGDALVEGVFRSLLDSTEVTLLAADRPLWEDAARLRAATGLKTTDALHAATALRANCALFITNDTDFRRVQGLPVVMLNDLVEESGPV